MNEQWWHYATTDVPGLSKRNEDIVTFGARQVLDMFSPSNFPLTNPEVIEKPASGLVEILWMDLKTGWLIYSVPQMGNHHRAVRIFKLARISP